MASLSLKITPLDHRLAKQLLKTTTYQYSKEKIDQFKKLTPGQAFEDLITDSPPTIPETLEALTGTSENDIQVAARLWTGYTPCGESIEPIISYSFL